MKIYLVRHGDSLANLPDNERPLSEKGKDDINRLAHFVSHLKIEVVQIFHSEKLRAQQTANILSTVVHSHKSMRARAELDPLHSIDTLMSEIKSWKGDTLLVGHMPFLGKLVAELITGNENQDIVHFKAGSMLCLEELERQTWVIAWMLIPQLF